MKQDFLLVCDGCRTEEQFHLHNVRYHASYRRFCTNCMLKNHLGFFCPICFEVYKEFPMAKQRAMCFSCPSISHLKCAGVKAYPSFVCPSCSNPDFKFFGLCSSNKRSKIGDGGDLVAVKKRGVIDVESAKALVAAAEIASGSMNKAAETARRDAEKRVKEAALAKKIALEVLKEFGDLALKEGERERDSERDVNCSLLIDNQKIKSRNGSAVVQHNKKDKI